MIILIWYLLAQILVLAARCQDLVVPASWAKTTINVSRQERINRAAKAIDAFIASDGLFTQPPGNLSGTYSSHGEFLALIADFDIFTNQTRYKERVQRYFLPALQQTRPDPNLYAQAATRAYLAYRDEAFLDIAKEYWASSRDVTLSDKDVQSRSSPAKSKINSTIDLTCSKPDGSKYTLAGGTFQSAIDDNNLLITTGATANYLTLTALLAKIPSSSDQMYIDVANQMGRFMQNALYKELGVFHSEITMGKQGCSRRLNVKEAAVRDTAATMQALSLLALNSKSDNLTDVLNSIILHATGSTWNSGDG
ncbi:hypothetical protein PQX77_001510, partial [Marasmius sp. AFHP31]